MTAYPYFTGPMDLRYDPEASEILGADYWRHLASYKLVLSPRQWASVEAGSLTDKGSIPRPAHGIVSPSGKFERAYGVHDQLCEYLSLTVDGKPFRISRVRADELLYIAMEVDGGTPGEIAPVRAAVEAHRILKRVRDPSTTKLKRDLEARWRG